MSDFTQNLFWPDLSDMQILPVEHFQQKREAVLRRIMRKNKKLQRLQRFSFNWSRCKKLCLSGLEIAPDDPVKL